MTAPINRGTDPTSQRVYALIFNGITRASSSATDDRDWIRLSERERIAEHVYAELREGGIEVRAADGLAALRRVSADMGRCGTCSGSGIIRLPCNGCGGTGRGRDGKTCMACGGDRQVTVRCTVCGGSGQR